MQYRECSEFRRPIGFDTRDSGRTGADAETVFSFGGPVSSVCGKRRMELSRGHLANVVPDGKGSGGGADRALAECFKCFDSTCLLHVYIR